MFWAWPSRDLVGNSGSREKGDPFGLDRLLCPEVGGGDGKNDDGKNEEEWCLSL